MGILCAFFNYFIVQIAGLIVTWVLLTFINT